MLLVRKLGVVDFAEAWDMQKAIAAQRISGELRHDTLLLVEHPPVVTLGRSTKPGHLLTTPELLKSLDIALFEVDRGGDVTIHEPGQLVAYPIMDLKAHTQDLHWYLRQLEAALILALQSFGVATNRRAGLTGVWCEDRKLASIGVHARDWVTWHGLALNVTNDLSTFSHVVPCGIESVQMTTVALECRRANVPVPEFARVADAVAESIATVFGLEVHVDMRSNSPIETQRETQRETRQDSRPETELEGSAK